MMEILVIGVCTLVLLGSWIDVAPERELPELCMTKRVKDTKVLPEDQIAVTAQSPQFQLMSSGVYVYTNPGSLNETLYLPNGENMDTWRAPPDVAKSFPYYLAGYDYHQRPVWIIGGGQMSSRNFFAEGLGDPFQFHLIQYVHITTKSVFERQLMFPDVKDLVFILDVGGFGVQQLANFRLLRFYMDFNQEYTAQNKMDFIHEYIFVNMNHFGRVAFNIMKPALGQVVERMSMLGGKRSTWTTRLMRKVPKKYLPPAYGGSEAFKPMKVIGGYFNGR